MKHTRTLAVLAVTALAAVAAFAGGIIPDNVLAMFASSPDSPLLLAMAGALDVGVLMKSLDKIEDKLHQLPELADRVFALEQKGTAPPPVDGQRTDWAAKRAALTGPDGLTVLRKSDDFRSYYGGTHASDYVGLAPLLRGIAGMKTTEAATKALSVGTDAAGGFAVPRATFGEIMGALVPNSALLQAGAGVVPMLVDAKSVTTAIVNAIPTAAWRAENGAIAESDPTFRAMVAAPKSLSFRFKVSRELLMDAPNMERALQIVIAQAMAKELDRAGLRGSGTDPEPRGILNTAGIYTAGSGTNGASGPGYDTIVSVLDDILQQNAPMPTAAIMSPRSLVRIAGALDTTGQPKRRPDILANMQMVATSQIPNTLTVGTSTDCSELYVGDFTNLSFVMRETLSVQVLSELYAENGQIGFVGHVRADVVVPYPAAFAVVTGLR